MRVQLPPSAPLVASSDIDLTREGGPRFVVIAGLCQSRRQLRALHILQDNEIGALRRPATSHPHGECRLMANALAVRSKACRFFQVAQS